MCVCVKVRERETVSTETPVFQRLEALSCSCLPLVLGSDLMSVQWSRMRAAGAGVPAVPCLLSGFAGCLTPVALV